MTTGENGASSYWEESNVAKCKRWKCLQQLIIYLKDRMLADSKKECLKFLAISMETQEEVIIDHDHTSRDMKLAKRPFSYFPLTQSACSGDGIFTGNNAKNAIAFIIKFETAIHCCDRYRWSLPHSMSGSFPPFFFIFNCWNVQKKNTIMLAHPMIYRAALNEKLQL